MTQDRPAATQPRIEMCCHIDSSMLGLLRGFVSMLATHLGFSEEETNQIEICVDEACANALEHAYRPQGATNYVDKPKELFIEIFFQDRELTIRVIDHGCGFSDAQSRISSVEEYSAPDRESYRGLGLYMIRKFMDRFEIRSEPGRGTTVEMTKVRR